MDIVVEKRNMMNERNGTCIFLSEIKKITKK